MKNGVLLDAAPAGARKRLPWVAIIDLFFPDDTRCSRKMKEK